MASSLFFAWCREEKAPAAKSTYMREDTARKERGKEREREREREGEIQWGQWIWSGKRLLVAELVGASVKELRSHDLEASSPGGGSFFFFSSSSFFFFFFFFLLFFLSFPGRR